MSSEYSRVEEILQSVYNAPPPKPHELFLPHNYTNNHNFGVRRNSVCVEDCSFGDSGKGHVVQEINSDLIKKSSSGILYSYRWNGTRNAGHEIITGGAEIALHQLPVACTQEGATAILGKGMLIHPNDLVMEIHYVESKLGARIPGTVLIDSNAVVITDIHSAYEKFTNQKLDVGHGATGSGVAQGYSSWYEKRAVTVKDFVSDKWRDLFTKQYDFYSDLMGGTEVLAATLINRLTIDGKRATQPVGPLNEYLDQLEEVRKEIIKYVADTRYLVEDVWKYKTDIPFTFEGAQGGALDPYYGVYPDVTASRPIGRIGIPDSTEAVVKYEEISMTLSTIKTYMSSVGSRVHPYSMDENIAGMYRTENDETGRSTGRDRGIYPIDLVVMQAIKRAAGYRYLAVTHLDSNHPDIPIEVVTHYVNKKTGQREPYRPYQWHWDQVEGEVVRLPSWDGKQVAQARKVEDLPPTCLQYLMFLSEVLAPVAIATVGPELGKSISFIP